MAKPKNAFYAQSGGVTSVINASACGVIETARKHKDKIGKLYAGRNGIIGALTEDLIDTGKESKKDIAALRYTPSGAFGSCRYKLKGLDQNKAEYERLVEVFKAHNIGYFFYNGGGDSADTCLKVSQIAQAMGYPLQAIHVPKTVDNDLPITDCCPGFGSVAKYIAVSAREASFDVASMCKTSTKVFVMEVMGRHAGWIAAAGGMASSADCELPIVILFPEIEFNQEKFLTKVDNMVKKHGYCSVIVSEGVKGADGKFLAESGLKDAFGHAQLGGAAPVVANMVKDALGYKYHWAVADYLQRAARHIASKTMSSKPMRWAKLPSSWRWRAAVRVAKLKDVANVEKKMPRSFITRDGFGITPQCRTYLQPLIAGEDYPPYKDGLPAYVRLKNESVAKKLKVEFKV